MKDIKVYEEAGKCPEPDKLVEFPIVEPCGNGVLVTFPKGWYEDGREAFSTWFEDDQFE